MKITDDLTQKLTKAVREVMASAENKDGTRSKREQDFVELHTQNVSVVDLTPDEKPFHDVVPAKLKESAALLTEAPVKSSAWIDELSNVLARSSDTKNLTMAFEAWANSLYKTPAWQSIEKAPILWDLIMGISEALDVYIGYSAEDYDTEANVAEGLEAEYNDKTGRYDIVDIKNRDRNAGLEKEYKPANEKDANMSISIDGKVWSKNGKALKFSRAHAQAVMKKIKATRPSAKLELVKEDFEPSTIADKIEKEWINSNNPAALIKKYSLVSAISKLRPGEVKLGLRNQLNGKKVFPALDSEGELIFVSGTESAPKIRYPRV
jgi:hypothetical protein